MANCKNPRCLNEQDKLNDDELCDRCHDIWLDNLLKNTDIMKMVELNRYAKDIGIGAN